MSLARAPAAQGAPAATLSLAGQAARLWAIEMALLQHAAAGASERCGQNQCACSPGIPHEYSAEPRSMEPYPSVLPAM